jgi:hypothetical protein
MRFAEHFNITRTAKDDWFDPHLTVDTPLFLDPVLILHRGRSGLWRGAHDRLIEHFVRCYHLVARGGHAGSPAAKDARRLLTFPEPSEFCLGYTAAGTRGSGGGTAVARQMANAIAIAIAAGLAEPEHIEELGILNEGIGADRISDAVCNVLKGHFVRYTQAVAQSHGIPVEEHRVRNAECFLTEARWAPAAVHLPTNPTNGHPVLLVPERFLNDLPILNADDWFDSSLNADLRDQLNLSVGKRARKEDIVRFAQRHPGRIRQWARDVADAPTLAGYDFADDPKGIVKWDGATKAFAAAHPISSVTTVDTQDDLRALLVEMLDLFKHFVEEQGGWSLLWVDPKTGKEKPESAAQLLFLGMAQPYFRSFGVELDREVNLGRGPVDFKLSKGTPVRMLLEFKKGHNGKFWNGLDQQLPSYLLSDDCPEGWFVAIQYRSGDAARKKFRTLPRRVRLLSNEVGRRIDFFTIDARPKPSASKLTGEDEP